MNELRPNDQRAKAAIAMIWAFLSINIFHIVFKLFISPTSNHLADRHIRENLQTVYDTQHFFSEFIALANYLMPFFMIIMFIRWFRRAYLNLGIITNECFHDDSWAVKGWFVPVLNLYIPYQIMKELYDKTNSYLLEKILFSNNSNSYIKKLNIKLVKWWWISVIVVFIMYTLLVIIVLLAPIKIFFKTQNLLYSSIKILILLIAGLFSIRVIQNYSRAETLLYGLEKDGEGEKEDLQ